MRLMIIGNLEGQLGAATSIAAARGAKVTHFPESQQAFAALCNGKGADLVMVAVQEDIAGFIHDVRTERISVPRILVVY